MNLREQMAKDVQSVFMNPKEFSEIANIDGDDVLVLIANDIINGRPRLFSTGTDPYAKGVYRSTITFLVKPEDLGYMPEENQDMRFNGKICIVKSVLDSMGILEIMLESNQS